MNLIAHIVLNLTYINQVTTMSLTTTGGNYKLSTGNNTKKPKPTGPRKGTSGFKGDAKSNIALFGKMIISGPNQPAQLISIGHVLSSYVGQTKCLHWDQYLRDMVNTRNQDFFMPTRTNIALYDRVAADDIFTFANFNRKNDYTKDKELWKQELSSTVKEWNKFITDGEVIYLAIKG